MYPLSLDLASLDRYFDAFRDHLVRHCLTFTQDHDTAADVAQDTYLAARASLDAYRGEDRAPGVRAWLLGIASNLCRREYRRRSIHGHAFTRLCAEMLSSRRCVVSRGGLYDAALRCLRTADIAGLDKQILRLRIEGYTLKEIGRDVGLDASTVKYRLQRSVAWLNESPMMDLLESDFSSRVQTGQIVTVYHRPTRTGAALAREKLQRLK